MKNIESLNHVTGKSIYLDDIPLLANTVHGAIFLSPVAHGLIKHFDVYEAERLPGVEKVFTWRDIKGKNDIGGIISDETLFAQEEIHYMGQPLALVVANDLHTARKALKLIELETQEAEVITDPRIAKEKGSLLIPSRTFSMGHISQAWSDCEYIFEGRADTGAQEHLYLETQGAYAYTVDNRYVKIHSSTQGPTLIQKVTARVLDIPMNCVEVDVARLGGGFGGKEDQATSVAVMAAMAAFELKKPVKISLPRSDDMVMTGKRHPYSSDFRIGLNKDYKIVAYKAEIYQNGGAAADLSPAIMERTLFHSTNAYFIPNTEVTVHSCKTNLPPNTAFRGFGAPQGVFVIEAAIAAAATGLNVPARVIQEKNLLNEDDLFQYGQIAKDVTLKQCFNSVIQKYNIEAIEEEIAHFNRNNTLEKKGMAVIPICFGISFTNTSMNQARALVHIYQDGSIGISTGAVEMGQGVNTKMVQIAAGVFSVNADRIKIDTTNTSRVANTSPTAASSGTDLNGNALLTACNELLKRLCQVAAGKLNCPADDISLRKEKVFIKDKETDVTWAQLVNAAFLERISLTENGHYSTPQIFFDKSKEKGHPFTYHVYGSAIVIAGIDCLKGTFNIDRIMIVHDYGNTMNQDIDNGQMEGGVIQGIGWMTMEEIQHNNDGKLLANSLSTYKVPDIYSIPKIFDCSAVETEGPALAVFKSKAVGEPPFLYSIGAFFAVQNAIKAFNPEYQPDFDAPLTPEKVLMRLYSRH